MNIFELMWIFLDLVGWSDLFVAFLVDVFHLAVYSFEEGEFLVIGFFLDFVALLLFAFEALDYHFLDCSVHLDWTA